MRTQFSGRTSPCQGGGRGFEPRRSLEEAGVAELADALDLKSCDWKQSYRFDSGPRHRKEHPQLNWIEYLTTNQAVRGSTPLGCIFLFNSGSSSAWQSTWFGTKVSQVRILSSRLIIWILEVSFFLLCQLQWVEEKLSSRKDKFRPFFFLQQNRLHNIHRGFTHYKYYRATNIIVTFLFNNYKVLHFYSITLQLKLRKIQCNGNRTG